jgi:hypothetical protein
MPENINKSYEATHLLAIKHAQDRVSNLYRNTIKKIYAQANNLNIKGTTFKISQYPEFNKTVNNLLNKFRTDVELTLVNGLKGQWELSIEKNAVIIHKAYGKENILNKTNSMIYDPQAAALEQYRNKTINGLGLSDRVWKNVNQFRSEIEKNLYAGISEGKSAALMAQDQVKYLENPSNLFRRVRDAEGNLQLSEPAREYNPGQGIYRSSYKNALRLTRVVINGAYRQADMIRFQQLPFILSYSINLSNSHPRVDICDALTGIYPKIFIWTGWHPQCLCSCTSNLASPEEFARYQEALLNGTEKDFKFKGTVEVIPDQLKNYIELNMGKMDKWKRKPDWVLMNGVKI